MLLISRSSLRQTYEQRKKLGKHLQETEAPCIYIIDRVAYTLKFVCLPLIANVRCLKDDLKLNVKL